MVSNKKKISYDFQEDIYIIKSEISNYYFSHKFKNFIFDFNEKKEIIAIEILDASKLFGISRIELKNIVLDKVEIIISKSLILFKINLNSHNGNSIKTHSYIHEMLNSDNLPELRESFRI